MNNVITVDAKEYGIEETKAAEIAAIFKPMLEMMETLEGEANQIFKLSHSPKTAKLAKACRLKIVKVRTNTAKIHKIAKAEILSRGRFLDDWKRTQLLAGEGLENRLKEIEKHAEIEAQKVINALQLERGMELEKYEIEPIPGNLGVMEVSMWDAYLIGVKANYEAIKEAERKAEADRLAKEKAEREEQERIKAENEKLKAEQAELKAKAEAERIAREKKELARIEAEQKKAEELRVIQEKEEAERKEKQRIEQEKHEAELAEQKRKADELQKIKDEEARVIREEQERKLAAERAERAKIEAELREKAEAEQKELARIEAEKQAELSKGDSAKVQDLIQDFKTITSKYTFESELNKKMFSGVCNLVEKVITFINK